MPRPPTDKRERIVQTATELVYAQGFHSSSLADIARAAGVPTGSVYYFFKAKEDLGRAVVDAQVEVYGRLCAAWDALEDPADRLVAFLGMTAENRDALARSGCPVGTLCGELGKDGGALAEHASAVFRRLLRWIAAQFEALGCATPEATGHAEHLLAAIEGATLLTHTFRDPTFVTREVDRLTPWIRSFHALEAP